MRVMVDGVERGRLNPVEQSSISFSAGEDAEIIEVKTLDQDGELLLATHLLTSFEKPRHDTANVSIRLEGGQELSLNITRRAVEASETADFLVKFGYRETDPRRAARLWWQGLGLRLNAGPGRAFWADARTYLVAGSVAVICLLSYLAYVRLSLRSTVGPAQTSAVQTTVPGPDRSLAGASSSEATNPPTASKPTAPKLDQSASQPAQRAKSDRSTAAKVATSSGADVPATARDENVDVNATRSAAVVPNLKLSEVKKVYLEIRGEGAFSELRSDLVENLRSSGVVTITNDTDEADAALKIVVSQTGAQIEASAVLVNARGTVLWPKGGRRHYFGEVATIASQLTKDLLSEIRR